VQRGLTPRELLQSSKLMSEYIGHLLLQKKIVRFGLHNAKEELKTEMMRLHQGVLKMVGMGSDEEKFDGLFQKNKNCSRFYFV
jgi:hypothetical protein